MTAAYMQILIHAVNDSLFPDVDPAAAVWTGPPPEIVTVQSLLYASVATSLFAAFLAMLGKQWVNRYLRNRGGSAADKSRDRQRKLDGLQKWRFHLAIEGLPVMLQLALLLLWCALSQYLWAISRTVAGVIIAVAVLGVSLYVFLTLAATLHYDCPYQTPPSTLIRTAVKYLTRNDTAFARSLRSLITSFPSIKRLGRILFLGNLRPGVRSAPRSFRSASALGEETEHVPLAIVVTPPAQVFKEISVDWEVCKADVRCIFWVLESTTDMDVIFSTVRFAADTVWYPEIARVLSPHILADLLFDCLLDGHVIPGKSEHASSVGMALVSVLSAQLGMEPENEDLKGLCEHLVSQVRWGHSSEPTFLLVVQVLTLIASVPTQDEPFMAWRHFHISPSHLSTAHKLWLSRVLLQTVWRWRRAQGPTGILYSYGMAPMCRTFAADGEQMPDILKTNLFLILAISLGLQIDIHDLYPPNNKCVNFQFPPLTSLIEYSDALKTVIHVFHQQLQLFIMEGKADHDGLTSVLLTLIELDPFRVMESGQLGLLWITEILNSGYEERQRVRLVSKVMELLGKHLFRRDPFSFLDMQPPCIPPLSGFLSLSEKLDTERSSGFIALRILATVPGFIGFNPTILPVLTSSLLPTHPLQARYLALNLFLRFTSDWFYPRMENVPTNDLNKLVQAVGDPFQFPDLPLQDGKPVDLLNYSPMVLITILIEFASSDLWGNHLRRSNFTSFEEMVSTLDGKRTALTDMSGVAIHPLPKFLCTATKLTMAVRRLEALQCLNTAEVVIMWAWTAGVVNPVDHDTWQLIERDTLRFYQTYGMERIIALKRHVTDAAMNPLAFRFFVERHRDSGSGLGSFIELPVLELLPETVSKDLACLRLSQACQLRRLYHLFGHDPATWKEAVAAMDGDKEMSVLSGHSATPVPFVDWACDYP